MTVTLRLGTPGLRCQGFWNPSSTFPRNCCGIEPKQTPQRSYNIQEDWPGKDRMNKEKSQCSFKGTQISGKNVGSSTAFGFRYWQGRYQTVVQSKPLKSSP